MGWGGKAAGALIGGLVGGPLGAALGAVIGHFAVDTGGIGAFEDSRPASGSSVRNELGIVYGIGAFLAYVARADGTLDEREKSLIHEICRDFLRTLIPGIENSAESEVNRLINEAMNNREIPSLIFELARREREFRLALLVFAWRVAAKDMKVTEDEVAWIARVAMDLGAEMSEVDVTSRPYYRPEKKQTRSAADATILGVTPSATHDEIKSAYRKLSLQHHPDRHPDASEAEKQALSRKFAEITSAYRRLTDSGGVMELFALQPDSSRLFEARSNDVAQCFICSNKVRLPEEKYHTTARCPKCQALLLFEMDIAQQLIRRS